MADSTQHELRTLVLPYSEVCMHMLVAGQRMLGALVCDGTMVQLHKLDGSEFSFPITRGEAGWDVQPDSNGRVIITDRGGRDAGLPFFDSEAEAREHVERFYPGADVRYVPHVLDGQCPVLPLAPDVRAHAVNDSERTRGYPA